MKLDQVVAVLEELVPLRYAESWDNVGLLLGDPGQDVTRVLFCIDATPDVLAEAANERCDLVVAYHPIVFDGLKRIVAGTLAFDALRRGLACWSPHTALDVAPGGTSDVLAEALGLEAVTPLRPAASAPVSPSSHCKLVTFLPEEHVARVARELFFARAGEIGQYHSCSFMVRGTGTFFGEEGTSPAVGESGRLERVDEVRLEMVAPLAHVPAIVAALRGAHPYEEPAFDLVALHAPAPHEPRGLGRIGMVADPLPARAMLERVKAALGLRSLLVAGPAVGEVLRAACAPGSCGDLWRAASDGGAGLYLTGEMRHHDALAAARAGLTVACTLHSHSERAALPRLASRLAERLPSVATRISTADADPFTIE